MRLLATARRPLVYLRAAVGPAALRHPRADISLDESAAIPSGRTAVILIIHPDREPRVLGRGSNVAGKSRTGGIRIIAEPVRFE